MFLRRLTWAQMTKGGVPPLFVLRPSNFTPPNFGDEYPAPESDNKVQMTRARQMYEQRRVGTKAELELAIAKSGGKLSVAVTPDESEPPAKPEKEKKHGRRNP